MKFVLLTSLFAAFPFLLACASLPIRAQAIIHSMDFKNFTYPALCSGGQPQNITVSNGEYSKEKQMDGYIDRVYFNVFSTTYGDLNGDGSDEAVILSSCNTGGTGNFSEGFIYTLKAGKPTLLARITGGDRAYGGLRSAKIDNGILAVERNDPGENGANCCPELAVTTRYKLNGTRLVEQGKPVQRELFPTERVNFARGTTGSSFNVSIPEREGRRYIVGARAGQILKVSTNSDKVSLRLLNDAIVTEGLNSFTAKLSKNGDYTFEIQNDTGADVSITVSVRIQ